MAYYATPSTGLYFYIFDGLSPVSFTSNVGANWSKLYDRWSFPYMPDYSPSGLADEKVLAYDAALGAWVPWTPQAPEDMSGWEYNLLNIADQGALNFIRSSDGLTFTTTVGTNTWNGCRCNFGKSSGKWYWEMRINSDNYLGVGVCTAATSLASYVGNVSTGWMWSDNYTAVRNNTTGYCTSCSVVANDTVMCALDMDNRKFFVGKNGTWCGSGNPVAGTGYCGPLLPAATEMFPTVVAYQNYPRSGTLNFGDGGFTYTQPVGYYAMKRPVITTTTV